MGKVLLADVALTCSAEQKAALIGLGMAHGELVYRLQAVCQDAVSREIARLTTQGPESERGWQQRCNACRQARAEECACCGSASCGSATGGGVTGRDGVTPNSGSRL